MDSTRGSVCNLQFSLIVDALRFGELEALANNAFYKLEISLISD